MPAENPKTALSPADFAYVRDLVLSQSAIVLEPDKSYLVETRLLGLAYREGFTSVGNLVASLRANNPNGLRQKAVEAMTNNETSFFRDAHPFEALRKVVMPDLLESRGRERRLHIWCAACASGQEVYSVVMTLREHFPMLNGWQVEILASDLSTAILDRARQACYSQIEVNRGLPSPLQAKYFQKQGIEWQVKEEIRTKVQFRVVNLIENWPPMPPMDIILLRNVLIYFTVATKKLILGKVRRLLRPDGYLFLGGAETTLNLNEDFERVDFKGASCYRIRGER